MARISLMAALTAAAALAPGASAQAPPGAPDGYALTNVRIVVAPGQVIEKGTVVVRAGRIAAVGAQVAVPGDVARLDLPGHTVYPGLIDAATGAGLPRATAPTPGGPQGGAAPGAQPRSGRPEPPPELNPGRVAADVAAVSDTTLAPYRAAGVTMLGLAFESGIFPGQTAAISAAAGERGVPVVLRSPVSLQIGFGRRRGGYPGTLMGTLAYIRQSFMDARHGARVRAAFERSPASAPMPDHDPEHRALEPAAAGTQPVWIAVSRENDVRRAVALARDLGLDYVLLGAQEGFRATDLLGREKRPVLVSLEFPRPEQLTGRVFELHVAPAAGKDTVKERADSTAARALRGNAAALLKAGVPVALTGYGLARPGDLLARVRAVVEAGLPADEALRALTVTPARILGLERAAGTVETGKLANLVVTQGDLFTKDGKIRHLFIEGRRYDIKEPERAAEGQGRAAGREGGAARVAGQWQGTGAGPGGQPLAFTLELSVDGENVNGKLTTEIGSGNLSGTIVGNDLSLEGQFAMGPGGSIAIEMTAQITGNEMRGTVTAEDQPPGPFTATRTTPSPGSRTNGGNP